MILAGVIVGLGSVGLLGAAGASGTSTTSRGVSAPPYYHGRAPTSGSRVGHLPVAVAPPEDGLPSSWLPLAALERMAGELTGWLDEAGGSTRIAAPAGRRASPPRVYLGCELDEVGECGGERRGNVLAATSATRAWREQLAVEARAAGTDQVLVIHLEVAPHWIHQRNLKGAKEVRLGTDYSQPLPWLTSLDTPVYVLQLVGSVVDADGKVLRHGAEGLYAVRTPFRASAVGAQQLLSEADVETVRTDLARGDLPGSPLVWQVALERLVRQLCGSS